MKKLIFLIFTLLYGSLYAQVGTDRIYKSHTLTINHVPIILDSNRIGNSAIFFDGEILRGLEGEITIEDVVFSSGGSVDVPGELRTHGDGVMSGLISIGLLDTNGNVGQGPKLLTDGDGKKYVGWANDSVGAGGESGTDDQTIDVFSISGNNVQLSLEDDGEATKTVDISTTTAVTANTAKVGVTDGDKGDITVSSSGAVWSLDGSFQPLDADLTDLADGTLTGSKVGTGINADNITSGTLADARIASTIARDSEIPTIPADTLTFTWGIMDTVTTGILPGWKVPYAITLLELSSFTDANTTTFNLEERAETTPNTAGTDVISSDQVADNNQQETTTFSNAVISKDTWLVPTISATGDVSLLSITVRYVKN